MLCLEKLSHMIEALVINRKWKPARNASILSHLFFADDLVLFEEASEWNMGVLLLPFDSSILRGQKVNLGKSKFFVSPNA